MTKHVKTGLFVTALLAASPLQQVSQAQAATTGPVTVTNAGGKATSTQTFTVN